jgi:hypothetical protein
LSIVPVDVNFGIDAAPKMKTHTMRIAVLILVSLDNFNECHVSRWGGRQKSSSDKVPDDFMAGVLYVCFCVGFEF